MSMLASKMSHVQHWLDGNIHLPSRDLAVKVSINTITGSIKMFAMVSITLVRAGASKLTAAT